MENNENFVEQTENVVATTEEKPKTFSQEDVDRMVKEKLDEVLPGKIARARSKVEKEFQSKYGELESVLRAGTGKESVEEITDTFKEHYASRGVRMPQKSEYSAKDIERLATADAEEFIDAGYEDVVEEAERLQKIGAGKRTAREEAVLKALGKHIQNADRSRQLAEMGVPEDVYNSKEFLDFAAKFSPNTPVTDIYGIYEKTIPKKEYKTMGSMRSTEPADGGLKDFYSFEEASKFTKKDFDRNPALFKRVQESMTQWK